MAACQSPLPGVTMQSILPLEEVMWLRGQFDPFSLTEAADILTDQIAFSKVAYDFLCLISASLRQILAHISSEWENKESNVKQVSAWTAEPGSGAPSKALQTVSKMEESS